MDALSDIFILKEGRRLGPFQPAEALLLVDEGRLSYEDICLRAGETNTIRLREALDWDRPAETGSAGRGGGSKTKETFYPNPMPANQAARAEKQEINRARLIFRGHPHPLNYPFSVGLSSAATIAGIFLWSTNGVFLLAGLIFCMITYLRIAFERTVRVYLVTPERVEVIFGFVNKSSDEIRVRDIRAINVRTSGLKGLLGVGDVEFASAGGSEVEVVFRGVWKPHGVKRLVRAVQDQA